MSISEAPRDEDTGVSDAAVKEKTGKTWREWFALLDRDGAALLDRHAIAKIVSGKYGITSWWRHLITTGYESARDLREAGEKVGELGVRAGRTINAPVRALYDAFTDTAKRPPTWLKARFDQLQKALDKRPVA